MSGIGIPMNQRSAERINTILAPAPGVRMIVTSGRFRPALATRSDEEYKEICRID